MEREAFQELLKPVFDAVTGKGIDQNLSEALNREFPAGGTYFSQLESACHQAIDDGWMCKHGDEGRKFGRVIKNLPETGNLSVDVVFLRDVVGPHHAHPTGEICLTIPVTKGALFDGGGAGWCVNEPGSAHSPTVTNGEAIVLYLLPDGQIEFTK